MEKRVLGRTNLNISVVGFGGIPIQGLAFDEAEKVLHAALDHGINFLDTARGYTDSEEKIGRALETHRGEYILATKSMSRDAAGMTKDIETSLRNLRTDTIDLYQVHAIGSVEQLEQVMGPNGAMEVLDKARKQGKVRFIGVTGHSREMLTKSLNTGLFDTVQHPFNPLETEWLTDVIPAARAVNAGIIGMKPVAGGTLRNVPAALRFSLDRGVDIVIPGMDTVDQVVENASVGISLQPPSAEDIAMLEDEKSTWKGQFCRRCGYCKPCPNGLDIPFLLLIQAYYERYGLHEWALDRLAPLQKKYADCDACGECTSRCPYDLLVAELMEKAAFQVK
jgi:uncharacterized protein